MGRKKIGRNAPCPCGSGRKYKKCCGRTGDFALTQSTQLAAKTRADHDLGNLLDIAAERGVNFEDFEDDNSPTPPETLEMINLLAMELQSRQHEKGYSRDDIAELTGVARSDVDLVLDGNPKVRIRAVYAVAELLELPFGIRQRLPLDQAMAELASMFAETSNLEADVIDQTRHAVTIYELETLADRFVDEGAPKEAPRNIIAMCLAHMCQNIDDPKKALEGVADDMFDAVMRGLEGGIFSDIRLADGRLWKPVAPARTIEIHQRRQAVQEIARAKIRQFQTLIATQQKARQMTDEEFAKAVSQSVDDGNQTKITVQKIATLMNESLGQKSMTVDELSDETGVSTYELDLILAGDSTTSLLAIFAAGEVLGVDLEFTTGGEAGEDAERLGSDHC